jgi:hypothetical protein
MLRLRQMITLECQMPHSFVCNELRSSVAKIDTSMRKAIPVEQRIALTPLVFVNRCGFSYDWSPVWRVQIGCVCDNEASLQSFSCSPQAILA